MDFAMYRAGVKAPELATAIGVTAVTIRNWRNPRHTAAPNHAERLAIAVATNVPVEWLDPGSPYAGLRWATGEGLSAPYSGWFTGAEAPTRPRGRVRGSSGPGRVTAKSGRRRGTAPPKVVPA